MKGKIFAIFCFLIFTSFLTLNAQWVKTYGGSKDDYASSILQTFDGGYIVAGSSKSFGAGDFDFQIFKLKSDGTIEWQKTFGDYLPDHANSIRQTNDGGYIIGGSITIYNSPKQFWIIKLSIDGDIMWQRRYDYFFDSYAYSLQETNDGGYIVAGNDWISGTQTNDIIILKLSFDGTVEWTKTYAGGVDDIPSSIQQTSDSGYIVAGNTTSYGAGASDIWILKLASDGSIEWQKTYG
ncbi:MAG: hypothetical protein MUP98_00300, partial [Candidatus Aminicenantes bacterium]|nr:hypothetical protein [Candidatus Aminicenantes bacterium]